MLKTVKIGEFDVPLKSTAFTPIRFKEVFGADVIRKFNEIQKTQEIDAVFLSQITWLMAKTADNNIEDFEEWLEKFEMLDILKAQRDVMDLWQKSSTTTSIPKKK